MAKHNLVGSVGERIAAKWLVSKEFSIVETSHRRKWGEIDIVARKTGILHFIEVKTVSYETKDTLEYSVSHETWRPEEMVHMKKQERMKRVIETWLAENNYEGEWQIDVITIRMVSHEKFARVQFIENVVFE
jgi:putative endonuclease